MSELNLLDEFRSFVGAPSAADADLADALADALEAYANPLVRDFPTVRQLYGYDCGAACLHAVGLYYGVGPTTQQQWIDLVGATPADGTTVQSISRVARQLGLRVVERDGMALETLTTWTRAGIPVICPVQAYGSYAAEEAGVSGHYVVVLAADADDVVLMDPAAGKITVAAERFRQFWFDADHDGHSYYHFGMAIWLPAVGSVAEPRMPRQLAAKSAVDLGPVRGQAQRKAYAAAWLKRHGEAERHLAKSLQALYVQTGKAVANNVAGGGDGGFDSKAFLVKLKAIVRPHADWMLADGAWTEWQAHRPRSARGLKDETVGKPAWKPGQRHPHWQELPPEVQEAIEEEGDRILSEPYWDDVPETVRQDIKDTLVKGTLEGESDNEKADRIEEMLGEDGSAARAKTIARTESTRLLNSGHAASRDQLQAMGIVKGKEWLAIRDTVVRPDHEDADGQQVPNDEPFKVGDEEAMYPGDPDLSAAESINCRCTAIALLTDEEEQPAEEP